MAFFNELINRFELILNAPFQDLSVWWVLFPVILFWITLELYFGKHKSEELGWNTALGNGISLTWITLTLMKFLFDNSLERFTWPKFILVFLIMIYGFFIAYISFMHKFKSKVTFKLASPSPVYYLASIAILWSYGSLIIDFYLVIALILLYFIILGLLKLIKKLMPNAEEAPKDTFSDLV